MEVYLTYPPRLSGYRKSLQIRTSLSKRKRRSNTAGEARTPPTAAADQLVSTLTRQMRKNPEMVSSPAASRLFSVMMAQMHKNSVLPVTGAINMSPMHNNPEMANSFAAAMHMTSPMRNGPGLTNSPAAAIAATTTHPSEYLYIGKFYTKTYSDEHFHKVTSVTITCDKSLCMSNGRFVGVTSGARQVRDTG